MRAKPGAHVEQSLDLIAFQQAPIGLVMADQRIIVACNETFCAISGYRKDELIGMSFEMLYTSAKEFEAVRNIGVAALLESGAYSDQRILKKKDGSLVWCRFRAHTLTPESPLSRTVLSYAVIGKPDASQSLTNRERDVVLGLTRGKTSKEIAAQLGLSPRSVEDVRYRLLKKFGAKSTNDLLWSFINIET